MKKCPSCGHENNAADLRCPECGSYYSKIIELIEQEVADEEKNTWRGRYERIVSSGNIKQALLLEWAKLRAGLTKQAWFVLLVIFVFVFALIVTI